MIIQHTVFQTQNSADDLLSSETQLPQLSVAMPTVLSEPWAAGKSHADHMSCDKYDKTQDENIKPCGKPSQAAAILKIN